MLCKLFLINNKKNVLMNKQGNKKKKIIFYYLSSPGNKKYPISNLRFFLLFLAENSSIDFLTSSQPPTQSSFNITFWQTHFRSIRSLYLVPLFLN